MRRVVIAGMVGNGLEWYDFALYGTFAPILGKLFFPEGSAYAHKMGVWAVFAAGFIMRPIGAVLFGYLGDKYGRKFSLTLSILMMALPTACIGLLPTYASIGMWAPILLTVIRLLQGLSLAGQFSGSIAFVVEHAPVGQRGLAGSTTIISLCLGMLLGSLVATVFAESLSQEAFESWGWRIPFIIGVGIAFVGFYIRKHTDESPHYEKAKEEGGISETPFKDVIMHHPFTVLRGVLVYLSVTVPFYILTVYMNSFLADKLHYPVKDSLFITTVSMVLLTLLVPIAGWLSDRIGRKRLLMAVTVAYFVAAYPLFELITSPGLSSAFAGIIGLSLIVGFYIGPAPTVFVELFPTRVRYTGMALSYNLSAAIFGGTAPYVANLLIERTQMLTVVAFYIMLCAALSFIAFIGYHDRYNEELH